MLSFLKTHPFAVEAFFESSLVITFAVLKEEVEGLIPPCLQLDTFEDKWAFIAVAMVKTRDLRPTGFPRFLGNDFVLVGYRVFVKYVNTSGKQLRGLYILKSETNKKRMEFAGNFFTHYKYSTTDISWANNKEILNIHSQQSGFSVSVSTNTEKAVDLPRTSPFADWKQARRFAGPLPFTFSFLPAMHKVIVIEGVRQNWTPKPVEVLSCDFSFLNNMQLQNIELANAFIIENVPYHWKKGKVEKWVGV